MKRFHVNKRRSAKQFKKQIKRTKAPNVVGPMRGGIRL